MRGGLTNVIGTANDLPICDARGVLAQGKYALSRAALDGMEDDS